MNKAEIERKAQIPTALASDERIREIVEALAFIDSDEYNLHPFEGLYPDDDEDEIERLKRELEDMTDQRNCALMLLRMKERCEMRADEPENNATHE